MQLAIQNCMTEWSYASGKAYADPFNEVELDLVVTGPDGREQRVPAFWAGEQTWRMRYASAQVGPIPLPTEPSRIVPPPAAASFRLSRRVILPLFVSTVVSFRARNTCTAVLRPRSLYSPRSAPRTPRRFIARWNPCHMVAPMKITTGERAIPPQRNRSRSREGSNSIASS